MPPLPGVDRFAPLDRTEDLDVFDFIRLHLEGIAVEFDHGTSGNNLNLIFTATGPGPGPSGVPEPGTWSRGSLSRRRRGLHALAQAEQSFLISAQTLRPQGPLRMIEIKNRREHRAFATKAEAASLRFLPNAKVLSGLLGVAPSDAALYFTTLRRVLSNF